jgi:hypothetical protein
VQVEEEIETIPTVHNIGALSLNTNSLKTSFKHECNTWKLRFADNLHARAKEELERLTEYIRVTMGKLTRDVNDLDTLRFMMLLLKEVRIRESGIDMEIDPIMNMYHMLENFLPAGFMEKEEIDKKTVSALPCLALPHQHACTNLCLAGWRRVMHCVHLPGSPHQLEEAGQAGGDPHGRALQAAGPLQAGADSRHPALRGGRQALPPGLPQQRAHGAGACRASPRARLDA